MYLDDVKILGLTANGSNMMLFDNSVALDPQVSTTATFTAKLISGGTFYWRRNKIQEHPKSSTT
jgi:hypothetical protein